MAASLEGFPLSVVPGYTASARGIQIGTKLSPTATDEDIRFVKQLGIEWVMTELAGDDSPEAYVAIRSRIEAQGLKVYRLANHRCHNIAEVTLNLPGRDERIEEYLRYIRNLGKAGIKYATYAHMANGIWSGEPEEIRGGATARALRFGGSLAGRWRGEEWHLPLTHERWYTEEEIWENYVYFINKVVPVAEEAGVYIGIHPDDPPVYALGGIPRCVFGNFEGYRRAIELADSPHVGMCMCTGCWLEGGEAMGKGLVETIRYFGERKKLFKVHFRNVTAPLPDGFAETYLDDGYMEMSRAMQALVDVGFDGAVMSDHLPRMVGGPRAAEAYAIGYIRGLVQSARPKAD